MLERLPGMKAGELGALLPTNWQQLVEPWPRANGGMRLVPVNGCPMDRLPSYLLFFQYLHGRGCRDVAQLSPGRPEHGVQMITNACATCQLITDHPAAIEGLRRF